MARVTSRTVPSGSRSRRATGPSSPANASSASLDYGQIDELMGELPAYLQGIVRQATLINAAVHQQYIAYPIDTGLA